MKMADRILNRNSNVFEEELLSRKILGKFSSEVFPGQIIFFSPYAGDMLELWAVDLPELYHLNDVIVFSTRGDRKYLHLIRRYSIEHSRT